MRPDGSRTEVHYSQPQEQSLYVRTLTDLDAGRRTESYQFFDKMGRPARSFLNEGGSPARFITTDTKYDALGRAWRTSLPYRTGGLNDPVNPSGRWTETTFDVLGRVAETKTADGAKVTTGYSGDRVLVTDQAGKRRISVTDALGNLREVWEVAPDDPARYPGVEAIPSSVTAGLTGAAHGYKTQYFYDALGNLRRVKQDAQQRFFAYDSLGRLLRAKNPEQGAFTPGGDFPALTDSTSGVSNSQWSLGYVYDANGNLTRRIDARGVTSAYAYDALNRNTLVSYSDGTPGVKRIYDTAENGLGRFHADWTWDGAGTYYTHRVVSRYDASGRPLELLQYIYTNNAAGSAFTTSLTYDKAGNVTSLTYPSGRKAEYRYDEAGRPGDNGGQPAFKGNLGDGVERTYASQVVYDELGGMSQERFGTQTPVYNKRFYNVRGQLSEIRVSTHSIANTDPNLRTNWNRGAIINHYSASGWGATGGGPDNNGNLLKQDVYIPNDDAPGSGYSLGTFFYEYDALNRLERAREGRGGADQWAQRYEYDRWGNRTLDAAGTWLGQPSAAASDLVNEKQFDKSDLANTNRLYGPGDSARPAEQRLMRYDKAGNLTFDGYTGQGARSYDAENRMTSAEFLDGELRAAVHAYDADGRRVKRGAGAGAQVWQVYGVGGELLAEYAPGASPLTPRKEYGYRGGELLVTAEATQTQGATVAQAFVTGMSLGAQRADSPGWTGMKITTGAQPVTVSSLGRLCAVGNSLTHDLRLIRAGDNQTVASAAVAMAGCAAGQFKYAPLASPVTLPANTDYLVVSYEVGTDKFHDWTGTALTTTSVAAVKHGVYTTNGGQTWGPAGWPGNSYVPLDFQYQTGTGTTADVRWLVTDHLGTPRMVLDQTGSLSGVSRRDYFPFGEEIGAGIGGRIPAQGYSGPERLRHGFTGHEKDGETRLNFAQSRYHSPAQGRFTSPDRPFADQVAGDPQSWNLYSYVRNNPLTYTDPLGLWRRVHHNSGEFWEAKESDTLSDLAGILGVSTSSLVRFYGSSRVGIGQIFDVGNYREYQEAQDLSEISAQQELQERKVVQYYVDEDHVPKAMEMGLPVGALLRYLRRAAPRRANTGSTTVYRSINPANGSTQYVGITNNLTRRALQHLKSKGISIEAIPGLRNISRSDSRAVEQALIEMHGLGGNGGSLIYNKINSIAASNPTYAGQLQRGLDILKGIGYPGL